MVDELRRQTPAVLPLPIAITAVKDVECNKVIETHTRHCTRPLRVVSVYEVFLEDFVTVGISLCHGRQLLVFFQPAIPFVRHADLYPLDSLGLFHQVVPEEQITGLIESTLSRTQTLHTKAPKATVILPNFLPELLYVALFGFGDVAANIVRYC